MATVAALEQHEAAGDMPQGARQKPVLTAKARLGSVGKGGGCSLKASTVSGDVVLTAVKLVIVKKKNISDGARCVLLNLRTLLLKWPLFTLVCHFG